MKHLKTEIVLNASKEKVWEVLTDNKNYKNWNPFMVLSEGEVALGEKLTNTMMNKGKANVFKPIVTKLEPFKEFEWLGSGLGGMFKGRHYFILQEMEDGKTNLIHGEYFSGFLSGLIMKFIGEDTLNNFKIMNQALKIEVENSIATSSN